MSVPSNLAQTVRDLQARGLPRLEAQMLVLLALGRDPQDRAWLAAHDDQTLDPATRARLDPLVARRLAAEPMAYLVGHKDFHALRLQVDDRVLDPRDDTETLVDWALEIMTEDSPDLRVLDLGTGSGAIALALAKARPHWQVTGSDASPQALEVARLNGQALGLRVDWVQGDWLGPFGGQSFGLIVSNPPYIPEHDPHLSALHHEPRSALASGPDGLSNLRAIIARAPQHLQPGGWLLLEHGHDQAGDVQHLLQQAGFSQITSRADLAGILRCSGGCWPSARFCHP
jgi:release factor glutamine methyltransferase